MHEAIRIMYDIPHKWKSTYHMYVGGLILEDYEFLRMKVIRYYMYVASYYRAEFKSKYFQGLSTKSVNILKKLFPQK